MGILTSTEARDKWSYYLGEVNHAGKRFFITKNSKPVAAMVPARDLELLEMVLQRIEDHLDVRDAQAAFEEAEKCGTISIDELAADLGI